MPVLIGLLLRPKKKKNKKKKVLSLPGILRLVGLLLLPLSLSSHLLQLLSVFPLDEALLMSHLWEVIWYRERQSGKQREVDQGEQIKRERHKRKRVWRDKVSFQLGDDGNLRGSNCGDSRAQSECHVVTSGRTSENVAGSIAIKLPSCCYFINNDEATRN